MRRYELYKGVVDFNRSSRKKAQTRQFLIDTLSTSPPEPLRVSEFQTYLCTRLDEARAQMCLDLAYPLAGQEEIATKCQLERKHQLREV